MSGTGSVRASSPSDGPHGSQIARYRVPASVTDEQIDALVATLDQLLHREGHFALVVELDDQVGLTAPLRRKLALALEARTSALRTQCRALAFVAKTPTAVGAHTAIRWLTPAVCAERVFISTLDADGWARARLEQDAVKP